MTSNTTPKSLTQKTLDGLREEVAQEEHRLSEQEPHLCAETIKVARECIAAVHHRLDQTQEIYDRTPHNLSLGHMIEVREHLNEKLHTLNKNLIEKHRTAQTSLESSANVSGTKL